MANKKFQSQGDRIKVVLIDRYNQKTFEQYADATNQKDLAKLIVNLEAKGISLRKAMNTALTLDRDGWW